MPRRSPRPLATLLSGVATAALSATAWAAPPPPPAPLVVDAAPPPATPVIINGSKIYNGITIGQNNPGQVVDVTGDTLNLGGLTIGQNVTSGSNTLEITGGYFSNGSVSPVLVGGAGSGNSLLVDAGSTTGISAAGNLVIGNAAGSTANQVVIESGNLANYASQIFVGEYGASNTMSIANGGYMFSIAGILGDQAGADGNSASVSGTGSAWALAPLNGVLVIGGSGNNNVVQVTGAGTISFLDSTSTPQPSQTQLIIGSKGNGNQLYLSSGGSVASTGYLTVGDSGSSNLLTIDAQGTLSSTYSVLGKGASSSGNVADIEFDGLWNIDSAAGWLIVGQGGSNNLVNVNGGIITLSDLSTPPAAATPDIVVGALGGSGNNLSIGYSGSVSHPGDIYVGENGSGNQLNLYFSGALSTGGAAYIGGGPDFSAATFGGTRQAADNNLALIDGTDTVWTIGGALYVGAGFAPSSSGNSFSMQHGAVVRAGGDVFLGYDASSNNNLIAVTGLDGSAVPVPTNFSTPGAIRIGITGDNVETPVSAGNTLQVGSTNPDFYDGSVSAAQVFVGNGNTLAIGGGGSLSTGGIAFGSTSTYEVLVNSTDRGALNVSGSAIAGGTVTMGFGSSFDNRYVILTSADTKGAFTLDTSNLSIGLTAQLETTPTETAIAFVSQFGANPTLSANEQQVADAIDQSFNSGSSIPGELALAPAAATAAPAPAVTAAATPMAAPAPTMTAAAAPMAAPAPAVTEAAAPMAAPVPAVTEAATPTAFMATPAAVPRDARAELRRRLSGLTGEVGASGGNQAMVQASRSFLSLLIENGLGTEGGIPAQHIAAEDLDTPMLWGSVFGTSASLSGDSETGSHDTDVSVGGLAAGVQASPAAGSIVGVALAGGRTSWSLDGTPGSGDSNFMQIGAYGAQRYEDFYISAAASVAFHAMSTERNLNLLKSYHYDADFNGQDGALRVEGGYRIYEDEGNSLTPYAAFEGQYLYTGSYDENGNGKDAFALSYDSKSATALRSELGLAFMLASEGQVPRFALSGRAAWAHDWNNGDSADVTFQSIHGAGFTVSGAEMPDNVALVSATATAWLTDSFILSASFDGEFGDGYDSLAGALSIGHRF